MQTYLYLHKENIDFSPDEYRGKYPLKHFDYSLSRNGGKANGDRRNPDRVGEMWLCGQPYLLSEFDIAYESGNYSKEYIEAYAVFSEPVSAEVENWIMKADKQESGTVRFCRNSDALN